MLQKTLELVEANAELQALWKITNVTADRLDMTDHGIQHFAIVGENALTMLRLLHKRKITLSICQDYDLSYEHAELVVFLAAICHDLGMSIHRIGHEEFSLFITQPLLQEMLSFLPMPEKTIVLSEVLHAIISHRSDGKPLTVEAGVVRVGDALDMSQGRTRFPYDEGKLDIHSVSAQAIDTVTIKRGTKIPIQVDIVMNHTAGLFQVDELLKKKVIGSGIEKYTEIKVYVDKGQGRQLFRDFYRA